jgi:hypothetical protein
MTLLDEGHHFSVDFMDNAVQGFETVDELRS